MEIKVVIPDKRDPLVDSFSKRLTQIEKSIKHRSKIVNKTVTRTINRTITQPKSTKNDVRLARIERALKGIPKLPAGLDKKLTTIQRSLKKKPSSSIDRALVTQFERIVTSLMAQGAPTVQVNNKALIKSMTKNFNKLEEALKNSGQRVIPSPS